VRAQLKFGTLDGVKVREKHDKVINIYSYYKKYTIVILDEDIIIRSTLDKA